MKEETYPLFENQDVASICTKIETELALRNESPFWADKVVPFSRAILSVLIPLRDKGILFNPQGYHEKNLTPELFLEWSDFVSLKTLAFTLQISNENKLLTRTRLEKEQCEKYENIELKILGDYLSKYSINLEYENLDFPISNYNLHQGVSNVIGSLL